jgi:hypothetical protein
LPNFFPTIFSRLVEQKTTRETAAAVDDASVIKLNINNTAVAAVCDLLSRIQVHRSKNHSP